MKINVLLDVNTNRGQHHFDLEDLNLTQKEWDAMSKEDKEDAINIAVNELNEQPYWVLDTFTEDK